MLNRIAMFVAVTGLTLSVWACDKKTEPAPTPSEPVAAEPAPAEPAPAEPVAAEPAPAEPAPAEPASAEPTPAEPTPAEPTPAEPAPAEPAMVVTAELDITAALTEAGREADTTVVIDVPQGATVKEEFGTVIVQAGETFALTIGTSAADIAEARTFMETNDVQKFQRWVVDSPEVVAAEAEAFSRKSIFMTANVKVGEETFSCESRRGATSFDEAAIKAMIAACQTLRTK